MARSSPPAVLIAGALAVGLSAVLLLAIAIAGSLLDIPLGWFFRDPTVTLEGHPLTGMVSSIGVLVMAAGAAVSLFTWAATGGIAPVARRRFLLAAGLLTALMSLDDLFLIHDDLVVRYLGLSDRYAYAAYAVLTVAFAAVFRRDLLDRGNLLLPMAVVFLAGSVMVDQVYSLLPSFYETEWRIFLEDGLKLLGYACWTAGLLVLSWRVIQAMAGTAPHDDSTVE